MDGISNSSHISRVNLDEGQAAIFLHVHSKLVLHSLHLHTKCTQACNERKRQSPINNEHKRAREGAATGLCSKSLFKPAIIGQDFSQAPLLLRSSSNKCPAGLNDLRATASKNDGSMITWYCAYRPATPVVVCW